MLEIGSLIDGKYKILNEVGHGGMSVVYLAMNEHLADRLHGLLHRRHRAVAQNRPQQVAADAWANENQIPR